MFKSHSHYLLHVLIVIQIVHTVGSQPLIFDNLDNGSCPYRKNIHIKKENIEHVP